MAVERRGFGFQVAALATALVVGVVVLFVLHRLFQMLLLLFAGILLAVALDGGARLVERFTRLSHGWALSLFTLGLLGSMAAVVVLLGPQISGQFAELIQRLPRAAARVQDWLQQADWSRTLLEQLPQPSDLISGPAVRWLASTASSTVGILGYLAIVFFVGVYGAANPRTYVDAVIKLLPQRRRRRGWQVAQVMGHTLRRWLVGRLASMAITGILTAIGFLLIGLPLALSLGLIAGLLSFVPYLGPLMALVPAAFIGLAEGPAMLGQVLLVYLVVQTAESYLITPVIEKQSVAIPPAFLISAQVVFTVLAGGLGVFLATPLTVVAVLLVQMLYLEDVLGDSPKLLGDA